MKEILISIKPKYVADILNGNKTIEIRKKFPKDYVGWVYIYCTKGKDMLCYRPNFDGYACVPNLYGNEHFNGKVIARFWCDKVEEITYYPKKPFDRYGTPYRATYDLLTESCLEYDELDNYLNKNNGYAIHITKLEIFDSPKEISEFYAQKGSVVFTDFLTNTTTIEPNLKPLTRAPQSWCYVEI